MTARDEVRRLADPDPQIHYPQEITLTEQVAALRQQVDRLVQLATAPHRGPTLAIAWDMGRRAQMNYTEQREQRRKVDPPRNPFVEEEGH
jgi:hypothetical protein